MVLPILEDLFAKTKQHRQIRCSGVFFGCSGVLRCSGVFRRSGVFRCSGVPVFRCSSVPGFSKCHCIMGQNKLIPRVFSTRRLVSGMLEFPNETRLFNAICRIWRPIVSRKVFRNHMQECMCIPSNFIPLTINFYCE